MENSLKKKTYLDNNYWTKGCVLLFLVFGLSWVILFNRCENHSKVLEYLNSEDTLSQISEPPPHEPTWEDNNKNKIDTHTTVYPGVSKEEYLRQSEEAREVSSENNHSLTEAFIISHRFVKKVISTPSTVKWGYDESENYKIDNNTFYISSYFDAQNEFGAMVRRTYHCKIIFKDGEDATRCDELWISD